MPLEGEWARADVFRVLRDISSNTDLNWPRIAELYNFDLAAIEDPQGIVPITAWHGDLADRRPLRTATHWTTRHLVRFETVMTGQT